MIVKLIFSPFKRDTKTCLTKRFLNLALRLRTIHAPASCSLEAVFFWQKYQFDEFQWVLKGLLVTWCIVNKRNNMTILQFQLSIKLAKDVFHYFSIHPLLCNRKGMKSNWKSLYSSVSKACEIWLIHITTWLQWTICSHKDHYCHSLLTLFSTSWRFFFLDQSFIRQSFKK